MTIPGSLDTHTALAAALAGRYDIEREIGRGGMATVFLARDVRHDRRVAVKVLDAALGAVLGTERFLSEIRVTANLQHPNVLPLFDSGEAAGLLYYVMPFVDGESLRNRLDREKQLSVDEAVRITVAICNAAAYAHSQGVVHRDLKPENILLQSGQPIVADFGIALAVTNAGGARVTQTGISVGTPQYMSPEQAMADRSIDARSDVFAIGAMIYEMLVGEPPHTGTTAQAVISRLLTDPPRYVRETRPAVPEHIDAAIARALEKLPADRYAWAREFADALEGRGIPAVTRAITRVPTRLTYGALATVGVMTVGVIGASTGWWRAAHGAPPTPIRFQVEPPPGIAITGGAGLRIAVSPDGQSIAFVGTNTQLFVRHLDQLEPVLIAKAHPAGPALHFSADGKWLAYWDHGPWKIPIGPGSADAVPTQVAQHNTLGQIISFSTDIIYLFKDTLWSVPASGGIPRRLASMDTMVDVRWARPILLPDGKTIAFSVTPRGSGPGAASRLAFVSTDGTPRTMADFEATAVVGLADGILVFNRAPGKLMAVRFDASSRKILGEPAEFLPDRFVLPNDVSLASNGTLAYLARDQQAFKLETIDELGNVDITLPETRSFASPVPSHDGRRIAVIVGDNTGQPDIWVYNFNSRVYTRLTQTGGLSPSWSADDKRIAFLGDTGAYWTSVEGNAPVEPIPGVPPNASGMARLEMSHDGRYVVILRNLRIDVTDVPHAAAIPLGGGLPIPLLAGAEAPHSFALSPNGKWIAYEARNTRNYEIYIRPFPTGNGKLQVSNSGGDEPHWSPDGRTLYYRNDSAFRTVTLDVSGPMPRILHSDILFPNRDLAHRPIGSYAVHPDGKHFIVTHPLGEPTKLVVVTNWMSEVRARLAGK